MTLAIEKPRRLFRLMGAFLPAFLTANQAEAVTLRLRTPSQIINVGSTAVVGVEISSLGDFQSPSLSGFGLEVTFLAFTRRKKLLILNPKKIHGYIYPSI